MRNELIDRPGIPRERPPAIYRGEHLVPLDGQVSKVEVFHSTERPGLTPVFGSTCPPRGISGVLRRYAYKLGEGKVQHWLLLLMADRIDVLEGLGADLMRGHFPNLYKEAGYAASWKYDKKLFAKRALKQAAIPLLILGGLILFNRGRRRRTKASLAHQSSYQAVS